MSFHEIEHVDKQLFIDLALYAPQADGDEVDIFNWLVDIHGSTPDLIHLKLKHLRKMSFFNYKDDWTKAPRTCLKRWKESKDVTKVKEWCWVSLIHLNHCETITTFSIGRELVNLRELKIYNCSNLEELSWTQDVISEQLRGVMKLCFVDLSLNRILRILPDFSNCSELRELKIIECSSSVEPLHLHTCSSLQLLHIAGKINAPEVRSLQSFLKLRSVQLAWKASHKGLLVGNLPSLSKLKIAGPSVLHYTHDSDEYIVPHGHNLFHRHYPEETETETDELPWIRELTNLKTLHLNYIPLGYLPKGLKRIGSNLEDLNLRGCLLSQRVGFSEFPNLQHLSIAQTNVKELRGIAGLAKLEYLNCRFNFRLRKIPNLRRLPILKRVSLDQCPELQAIPRLPPRCFENPPLPKLRSGCFENPPRPENDHRLALAVHAFVNTAKSAIPLRLFAINDGIFAPSKGFISDITEKLPHVSLIKGTAEHPTVACDGCRMRPLIGLRYKAKSIRTTFHLCTKCFTNKCNKYDCNFTKSCSPEIDHGTHVTDIDYDLCHACFVKSGCDDRDFYRIHQTINHSQ